jgi:hypothetical protein
MLAEFACICRSYLSRDVESILPDFWPLVGTGEYGRVGKLMLIPEPFICCFIYYLIFFERKKERI